MRLLARLRDSVQDGWVLKGGMAVELRRPGLARATQDVDVVIGPHFADDPADPIGLHRTIVQALAPDPDGDGFVFELAAPTRLQDDAYSRPGWRFAIVCHLAGRRFTNMKLDVVARIDELGGADMLQLPDVLAFADCPTRTVAVADMRQQYAEKIHAMTRGYATGTTTRVKDLVDLVLLIEDGVPADSELLSRVRRVFAIRQTHMVPAQLPAPPDTWRAPFDDLTAEADLKIGTMREAHHLVASHWTVVCGQ